jgi:thiamine biosynthesis lipoprotein
MSVVQQTSFSNAVFANRSFRAMNTDISIALPDLLRADLLKPAEEIFHIVEQRFSRFLESSELSKLNGRNENHVGVSPAMYDLLAEAQHFHGLTDGLFDPAILPSLESSGYDRSFEQIGEVSVPYPRGERRISIADIELHPEQCSVTLPSGLRIDLGGIGKGYAVDLTVEHLEPAGDFLVNAGGDIFAAGCGPLTSPWLVSVCDPADDQIEIDRVALTDEAIATSSTLHRRWRSGGHWANHLIDPRTGESVANGVASVTVVSRSTMESDVMAKAALILGLREGPEFLETHGLAGLFVMENGRIFRTRKWPSSRHPITDRR